MFLFSLIRALAYPIVYLLYVIECHGKEKIPTDQNFILVCNHIHALDPVLIAVTSDFKFHTMAKAELFENAFLKQLLTDVGAFPVKRHSGDVRAFMKAKKYLENGEPVLVFPEGTRSKDGELQELKPGAAALCLSSKVPILPVQIIAPKGVKPWRKIHIYYGDVIFPEEFAIDPNKKPAETLAEADKVILNSFLKIRKLCEEK